MNAANWIAVAAVLAALLGSGITWRVNRHRKPKIVSTVHTNKLGAESYPDLGVQGIDTPQGLLSQTAPTIDVRLVNSGTGTALIVGCDIQVVWAHRFKHVRPPTARDDRGGAALLPASAHYVALLPSPEEAYGRSFAGTRNKPNPLEDALRGEDGLSLSHELKAGEADRFVVRVEVKPHGGGTMFDHAMPGDDRMAYQVRLVIRYTGGRRTQQLTTGKVGIVSPANELIFPADGEIRKVIADFRREVAEIEQEINAEQRGANRRPFDWSQLRNSAAGDLEAFHNTLGRSRSLSPAFLQPDSAIREFLADLEAFCRSVLAEMPKDSDLAKVFFPPARRTLDEIAEVHAEEFGR